MYISRNLWTPVRQIMEIDLRMGSLEGSDIPRYQVHSLHCHNVANVLVAIAPKAKLDNVPYAATFVWEVYTLNGKQFVKTLWNHEPIVLDTCKGEVMCPYEDWFNLI